MFAVDAMTREEKGCFVLHAMRQVQGVVVRKRCFIHSVSMLHVPGVGFYIRVAFLFHRDAELFNDNKYRLSLCAWTF